MAKRYIDADALYEQTAEWEARALAVVEKLNSKPLGEMDVNEITEWRKWSCVLNERSAFKHDVADAPTADVVDKERYDRLLENSTIIADALSKYQSAEEEIDNQITVCPMCPDCPDNCPLEADMREVRETTDDLISRQEAIDAIDNENPCVAWLDYAVDVIKALPSAHSDRKRGYWTSDGHCSVCGEHAPFWSMASTYHTTPYCYNCGAEMERRTDERLNQ